MAKVFIGVGHGGMDSGALGGGLREADVNLVMALTMAEELRRLTRLLRLLAHFLSQTHTPNRTYCVPLSFSVTSPPP